MTNLDPCGSPTVGAGLPYSKGKRGESGKAQAGDLGTIPT